MMINTRSDRFVADTAAHPFRMLLILDGIDKLVYNFTCKVLRTFVISITTGSLSGHFHCRFLLIARQLYERQSAAIT
jgi:hypothetical protein